MTAFRYETLPVPGAPVAQQPADYARFQRVYVQATGPLLSATAWQGYREDGRGAVIVDLQGMVLDDANDGALIPFRYVSDRQVRRRRIGWPDPVIRREVKRYSASTSFILLFRFHSGGIALHHLKALGPTPPDAFALYAERLGAQATH